MLCDLNWCKVECQMRRATASSSVLQSWLLAPYKWWRQGRRQATCTWPCPPPPLLQAGPLYSFKLHYKSQAEQGCVCPPSPLLERHGKDFFAGAAP